MRLGIDFGTSRTVVAFCDRGNYPVVSFTDPAGDACEFFPSVVAEREGELRFGFDALARASDPDWVLVRSFKRWLSRPDVCADTPVRVGSTELPIAELLARFLASLRRALETQSNVAKALARRDAPLQAVVAAPANAHGAQRFISLLAFREAGFEVLALLNEPSAAGFEYTHRFRSTLNSRRDQVVVYDLGGGTFDASLVRMIGARHEVVRTAGIARLGGDDFDAALADLVLAELGLDRAAIDPRALAPLLERCREAKEGLTAASRRVSIDVTCLGRAASRAEVGIDAARYYEACTPLVERTLDALRSVMLAVEPPEGATPEAGAVLRESGIAGIYVVGGASALPAVARVLRDRYGRRVHRSPYPSAAAAIGLAICADEGAGLVLLDRLSRVFGVFREAESGSRVAFDPIFARDLPLPAPGGTGSRIEREYRAAHNIGHFRFVECSEVDASGAPRGDMAYAADLYFPFDPGLSPDAAELARMPVRRLGAGGPLVRETYSVDENGTIEITIRNIDDDYEIVHRVGERSPSARTPRRNAAGQVR